MVLLITIVTLVVVIGWTSAVDKATDSEGIYENYEDAVKDNWLVKGCRKSKYKGGTWD